MADRVAGLRGDAPRVLWIRATCIRCCLFGTAPYLSMVAGFEMGEEL